MAYSFDRDETVGEGIRRNAKSQLDAARRAVEQPAEEMGIVGAVHDARKRCKKLRALARLVRPHVGDGPYQTANHAFRDAARQLSDIRDAQVMVDVFDHLVASAPEGMELPNLDTVRDELARRFRDATERLDGDHGPMERARALLDEGWSEIEAFDIDDDFDAVAGGVRKTYERAVKARETALEAPTPENLHEWRKRVKYHWYHVRMFTDAAPSTLEPWADRLHDLSDALGDDHDLAELIATVTEEPDAFGGDEVVDVVRTLAEGRSAVLRDAAFSLGARLTAEDPDAVVARLRVQWDAWKQHGAAPDATELADLPA